MAARCGASPSVTAAAALPPCPPAPPAASAPAPPTVITAARRSSSSSLKIAPSLSSLVKRASISRSRSGIPSPFTSLSMTPLWNTDSHCSLSFPSDNVLGNMSLFAEPCTSNARASYQTTPPPESDDPSPTWTLHHGFDLCCRHSRTTPTSPAVNPRPETTAFVNWPASGVRRTRWPATDGWVAPLAVSTNASRMYHHCRPLFSTLMGCLPPRACTSTTLPISPGCTGPPPASAY